MGFSGWGGASGAASGGNVQVTSYGINPFQHAKLGGISSGDELRCIVLVENAVGTPIDGRYTLLVTKPDPALPNAFVFGDDISAADYIPRAIFSFNPTGENIRVQRTGVGEYNVTFEGLSIPGGNVQATPHGSNSGYVSVVRWSSVSGNLVVYLNTFDVDGNPADMQYTLLVTWE